MGLAIHGYKAFPNSFYFDMNSDIFATGSAMRNRMWATSISLESLMPHEIIKTFGLPWKHAKRHVTLIFIRNIIDINFRLYLIYNIFIMRAPFRKHEVYNVVSYKSHYHHVLIKG